jgi:hypothetical protein
MRTTYAKTMTSPTLAASSATKSVRNRTGYDLYASHVSWRVPPRMPPMKPKASVMRVTIAPR